MFQYFVHILSQTEFLFKKSIQIIVLIVFDLFVCELVVDEKVEILKGGALLFCQDIESAPK